MITCRITLHDDLSDLAGGRREHVRRLPAPIRLIRQRDRLLPYRTARA